MSGSSNAQAKLIQVARADEQCNLVGNVPPAQNRNQEPSRANEQQLSKENKQIEQLHKEVNTQPQPISRTVVDLMAYCAEHQNQDALWDPTKHEDRYVKQRRCTIL